MFLTLNRLVLLEGGALPSTYEHKKAIEIMLIFSLSA